MLFVSTGFLSTDCPDVPDSVKSLWIRNYVERKYELQGKQSSEIPEVVFEKAEIEFALAEIVRVMDNTLDWVFGRKIRNFSIKNGRTFVRLF